MFKLLEELLLGDTAKAAEIPTAQEIAIVYSRGRAPLWPTVKNELTNDFNAQGGNSQPFFNHVRATTDRKRAA
jgi:hypothetical protein